MPQLLRRKCNASRVESMKYYVKSSLALVSTNNSRANRTVFECSCVVMASFPFGDGLPCPSIQISSYGKASQTKWRLCLPAEFLKCQQALLAVNHQVLPLRTRYFGEYQLRNGQIKHDGLDKSTLSLVVPSVTPLESGIEKNIPLSKLTQDSFSRPVGVRNQDTSHEFDIRRRKVIVLIFDIRSQYGIKVCAHRHVRFQVEATPKSVAGSARRSTRAIAPHCLDIVDRLTDFTIRQVGTI